MRFLIAFVCLFCFAVFSSGEDNGFSRLQGANGVVVCSGFEKLKSKDAEVRAKACMVLGKEFCKESASSKNGDRKQKAVDALENSLKDKDPGVRRFAGRSLDLIMREKAAVNIRNALEKENCRSPKVEFIKILGRYEDEASKDLLHELLADKDMIVRSESIYALGELGFFDSHEKIMMMLADQAEGVRVAVVDVSAKLNITEAAGKMADLLGDANTEVRFRAAKALKKLASIDQMKELKRYRSKEDDKAVKDMLDEIIKKLKEEKKND